MKEIIHKILHSEMNEEIHSITEIEGLGSVNKVFDVQGSYGSYIVRLNKTQIRVQSTEKKNGALKKFQILISHLRNYCIQDL